MQEAIIKVIKSKTETCKSKLFMIQKNLITISEGTLERNCLKIKILMRLNKLPANKERVLSKDAWLLEIDIHKIMNRIHHDLTEPNHRIERCKIKRVQVTEK